MKKVFLVILMSYGLISCSPQSNVPPEIALQEALDNVHTQYHLTGAVLQVKSPGFEGIFTQGAKPDAIFGVGSVTKTIISTMILKLEAQGKLSIHDTIGRYFPQYPRWKDITIEQLLNMTSGIFNYTSDEEHKQDLKISFKKSWDADLLIKTAYNHPDDFKPGEGWNYSNTGYLLLGKIIEKVTKQSTEEALKTTLFNPLNMIHTHYHEGEYPPEIFAQIIPGYYNGMMISATLPGKLGAAAGGIVMDANDLFSFVDHLFVKKDVLPEKQLNEMLTGETLSKGKMRPPSAEWALGLGIVDDEKLGMMYSFTGVTPTHTAIYMWIPEKQIEIVALAGLKRQDDKDYDIFFIDKPFVQSVIRVLE